MKSQELREGFLSYFEKNGHTRVASSSLVPANDPTLFFVNAGMVQFKDLFLGNEKRDYKRATTSQKCMRVSGKHNDLENVGHTPRHHTFFEMLGNFSFGNYFKKEAIAFGWEYLTKVVGLPKEQLYITVFDDDDEAAKLWKKHVNKSRIYRMGEKDNFWAMGETGPCGPCSEIHFDRAPTGKVELDDFESDRFTEIWNLVFMQFNRTADGKLTKLAKPSIDTGMGLERLASIIEGVDGNYETDLFMPVISELSKICGKKYGAVYSDDARDDISMRVVADHIRAMTFLISDGVQPSNEGRGYVLRRIIRRAARHGKMLGIDNIFFTPLAHIVIDTMGSSYPELVQHREFIEKVITNEEEKFNETLEKGLDLLDRSFQDLKKKGMTVLPGDEVFKLYDTFGFPKDLTSDIAVDAGFTIDHEGFESCMNAQRERARSAWKGSGEEAVSGIYKELGKDGIRTDFLGYDQLSSEAKILSIIKDGKSLPKASAGESVSFVVDQTPFYGESGGQVGDTGMVVGDGLEVGVSDTTRPMNDLFVHHGCMAKGELNVGDVVTLAVDEGRRDDIRRNHTSTHIVHHALREILGEHVKQSGSIVTPDRFRFDFSHFSALTREEILEIEKSANRIVRANLPVTTEVLSYEEAVNKGALAFFGEKYGGTVRMVSVGNYSCELCGGTHVNRSGDIGIIKIVGESSIASGVRRLEAVTGRGAEEYLNQIEDDRQGVADLLKSSPDESKGKLEKLIGENRKLKKDLEKARSKMLIGKSSESSDDIESIGDIKYSASLVEGAAAKDLRTLADNLKAKVKSGVVLLATEANDKTSLIVVVTKDLTDRYQAGALLKEMVALIGGTGGGRPDMAQGGGPVVGQFDLLKNKLRDLIKEG